ncbi:hypothetical protein ACWDS7_28020, partial [Streptosporangium sp. NPDC003464]
PRSHNAITGLVVGVPVSLPGPPAGASPWQTSRAVAGSVAATGLAGVLFCELRRRGGLAAPSLLHIATNSLGYLSARLAPAEPGAARSAGDGTAGGRPAAAPGDPAA